MSSERKAVPTQLGYNPPTFFWIAHYKDGTALSQFDPETGRENKFKEIDQSKLESFGWYPFTPELAEKVPYVVKVNLFLPSYVLHLREGQRLIAVQRNFIRYGLRQGVKSRRTIYLLGWQSTIGGRNVKSILYIHEDGKVEVSDNFDFK